MIRLVTPVILFMALSLSGVFGELSFNAWEKWEVVPDAVDVTPKHKLSISYDSGAKVNYGNKLTPTQVKDYPKFSWDADSEKLYLLCMIDLDVGSRKEPSNREALHYLVGNIPGSDISKGVVLAEFIGSGPRPDSGYHRYVFVVYEQPEKLTFDEKRIRIKGATPTDRIKFSIRNFAKKYNLGEPIAGNFYQAEWDETVPKLYAEWIEQSKLKPDEDETE